MLIGPKRSLTLASPLLATMLLAQVASADNPRPRVDYRPDGTVTFGPKVFPTHEAWFRSKTFQENGLRCGSEKGPQVSFLSPNDCSLSNTTINPEYNDGRVLVIQVVFHVIQRTDGTGAVSPALINSQIDILNEDFLALTGTPGSMGADSKVEFVLARFDPAGLPTTGIEVVTNNGYFNDPGSQPGNPMKQALHWDTTRYLNVYTNDAADLLGYATFPSQEAGEPEDGVVVLWSSVGRDAPIGPPYDQGRTLTHEVGHYLGLLHTFQGGCGTTYTTGDLVVDTHPEEGPHFSGCVAPPSGCGSGVDPIENYMDYSDDICMTKFSVEQTNRIRCSMFNHRTVNTKPTAEFTVAKDLLEATFTNTSADAESPPAQLHFSWNFGDGATATTQNPVHTYASAGTYTVTLEVVDPGSGASTTTESVMVMAEPPPPPDADPGNPDDPDADPGNPGDDDGGGGGGCCQTQGGQVSYLLCGLPVVLLLRRRRRRHR